MRSRSLAAQHDAAVARRLELLTTELAAVRGRPDGPDSTRPRADPWEPRGHTRIRAVPDPDADAGARSGASADPAEAWAAEPVAATVARLPGRHASRRTSASLGRRWAEVVPEGLRGRVGLGAGQLAVLAVLAVVGLALTCWWLVRSSGHEVAAPVALARPRAALATPSGPGHAAVGGPAAPTGQTKVVVDVTGRVRHPGIQVLHPGARVVDAIRAAGGARPGVDLSSLNLARVLGDGEQVVVGSTTPALPAGAPSSLPSTGAPVTGLVDLNTADQTALESLPEVGPVTAQAILAWRSEHGGFTSVEQLLDVDGIGDATLAQLTPYVTV
ncbi:MAG TPA: ComEA family DNA-binding protein [Nocardioides sp.]|nr:ComEA family DNA-binding protein [Nocardioides sp.]